MYYKSECRLVSSFDFDLLEIRRTDMINLLSLNRHYCSSYSVNKVHRQVLEKMEKG